jgi:hypothetical protein
MSLRTTCGKLAPISSPSSNSSLQRCIMNDRVLQIDDGDNSSVVGNVYQTLAEHQRTEPWDDRDLLAFLQQWAERFDVEFKLGIPQLALQVDRLRASTLGHFRVGHNGFGLKGEIAINRRYIRNRPVWGVLGTLLHEGLHAWQDVHGHPSARAHHNLEFRRKAASFGLLIDRRGVTDNVLESPFMDLLRDNGIEVPTEADCDEPDDQGRRIVRRAASRPNRLAGNSKLKKWSCGCTNVRCAVELRAWCCRCGKPFVQAL